MAAFATIATATALAATAGGSAASFAQAGKQNRLRRQAEEEAAKAMADARKKLEVNYFAALGINKEPYALEREAALVQGAMATEAGRESERGIAATAGRVQAAQQQQQRQIAAAMGTEMSNLDKVTAQEAARLRDLQANLDLEEAKGAQTAALEAKQAGAAAMTQGFEGVTSLATQLAALAPLYGGLKSSVGKPNNISTMPETQSARAAYGSSINDTNVGLTPAQQMTLTGPKSAGTFEIPSTPQNLSINPFDLESNYYLPQNFINRPR